MWRFSLHEVVFVPTGRPWMKAGQAVTDPEDRYLMTVIATASNPRFSVSRIEVDREGPTYTVETLQELGRQAEGDIELFFITGADAMLEIFHWKDPEAVLDQAHFIAATRPGHIKTGLVGGGSGSVAGARASSKPRRPMAARRGTSHPWSGGADTSGRRTVGPLGNRARLCAPGDRRVAAPDPSFRW